MIKRISALAATTALVAVPLAAPSAASANPLPKCVQEVVANAPGLVLNVVQTGRLPTIMGPFCS